MSEGSLTPFFEIGAYYMALKRKITKADHTALNPLLQAEYKAEGEDFVLDASGYDDPAELKRGKDRETENARAARAEVEALKTKLETITNVDARRAGDIETLEKSWKEKLSAQKTEYEGKLVQKDRFIQSTLVDSVAMSLAAELSGDNAALLLPHITPRLIAELGGEKPLTRILDKDGKPSAMSVEDLKKELSANKAFAPLIIASKASGGGAAGVVKPGNGSAATGGKKFKDLNDTERVAWHKSDPDGFAAASAEANKPAYA
jgi:hypothetical protein